MHDIPRFSADEARRRTDGFHELFYYRRLWDTTRWMGVQVYKCPFDLWIYQEILFTERPSIVIECGTAQGGTALYLAHMYDLMGAEGGVVTIDIEPSGAAPQHPRITYVHGSSVDPGTFERVRAGLKPGDRPLVILDSLHNKDHVLAELRLWHSLVPAGGLMIVEDTNINGHPVYTDFAPDQGPGAWEAVDAFLADHPEFEVDEAPERLLMTFNPRGYLRRRPAGA
ncbi:MAG: rhamnosyl O-methyltransferase [Phycisphaerae bacterium]